MSIRSRYRSTPAIFTETGVFLTGDTGNIDDAAGSLELGREVVAKVLAERTENGWTTREVAEDIARRIFRENAIDIYRLENLEY